jgi:hypothetical protein
MKKLITGLLVNLLTYLLGYNPVQELSELQESLSSAIPLPKSVTDILEPAKLFCAELSNQSQSGEYKRHQVLSKLMKLGASERDAGLAIEKVIRD